MVVLCGPKELEQRCSLADWLRIALQYVTPQRLKRQTGCNGIGEYVLRVQVRSVY